MPSGVSPICDESGVEQWPCGVTVSVVEQWNSGTVAPSSVTVSVVEQWNSGA